MEALGIVSIIGEFGRLVLTTGYILGAAAVVLSVFLLWLFVTNLNKKDRLPKVVQGWLVGFNETSLTIAGIMFYCIAVWSVVGLLIWSITTIGLTVTATIGVTIALMYYVYDRRPIRLPVDPCDGDDSCYEDCTRCNSYIYHREAVGDVLQRAARLSGQTHSFCDDCQTQGKHPRGCRGCRELENHHLRISYESSQLIG
jgi:hypothetical protein